MTQAMEGHLASWSHYNLYHGGELADRIECDMSLHLSLLYAVEEQALRCSSLF